MHTKLTVRFLASMGRYLARTQKRLLAGWYLSTVCFWTYLPVGGGLGGGD
jgi:hypothetical protein